MSSLLYSKWVGCLRFGWLFDFRQGGSLFFLLGGIVLQLWCSCFSACSLVLFISVAVGVRGCFAHPCPGQAVGICFLVVVAVQGAPVNVSCTLVLDSECTAAAALVPVTTVACGLRGP